MSARADRDEVLLAIAGQVARLSGCRRLQVGAIITCAQRERMWMGYNGGPRGGRNTCARDEPGRCGCLHAETNALIKVDAPGPKRAYLTHAPCELCAVALVNARVEVVRYGIAYRDTTGVELLADAGVEVVGPVAPPWWVGPPRESWGEPARG